MEIKTVHLVYYSATGNTQTVARAIGEALAQGLNAALREVDFTLPAARQAVQGFGPGDLVVAATPVYAGRVPNKMLPYVQEKLVGGGALAVPVVTFGNRSYDNGLKELQVELEGHGFRVVAGAGVPTEHVFSAKLAPGRPNGDDLAGLAAFGRQVAEKVAALTEAPAQPVEVRGEFPAPYYTPESQAQDRPGQVQWVRRVRRRVPHGFDFGRGPEPGKRHLHQVPGLREEVPHRRKVL